MPPGNFFSLTSVFLSVSYSADSNSSSLVIAFAGRVCCGIKDRALTFAHGNGDCAAFDDFDFAFAFADLQRSVCVVFEVEAELF